MLIIILFILLVISVTLFITEKVRFSKYKKEEAYRVLKDTPTEFFISFIEDDNLRTKIEKELDKRRLEERERRNKERMLEREKTKS